MSGCYPDNYCSCPCHNGLIADKYIICCCDCSFNKNKNVSPLIEKIQSLEKLISDYIRSNNHVNHEMTDRLERLEKHKHYQIDENRKISKRIDELEENYIGVFHDVSYFEKKLNGLIVNKKPHKCPVCDGQCGTVISGVVDEECNAF